MLILFIVDLSLSEEPVIFTEGMLRVNSAAVKDALLLQSARKDRKPIATRGSLTATRR